MKILVIFKGEGKTYLYKAKFYKKYPYLKNVKNMTIDFANIRYIPRIRRYTALYYDLNIIGTPHAQLYFKEYFYCRQIPFSLTRKVKQINLPGKVKKLRTNEKV